MREAWKRETYVRSQSFSSESAVKYLHVGRRKIQISPPLGEQDQSNALPQGQQRRSNPHPMPCLPPLPAGFTLIGALFCGGLASRAVQAGGGNTRRHASCKANRDKLCPFGPLPTYRNIQAISSPRLSLPFLWEKPWG